MMIKNYLNQHIKKKYNKEKNKPFDSIIFDLDGTLWSAIDSTAKTLDEVEEKHPEITKDITKRKIKSCMGLPFDDVAQIYYGYLPKNKALKYAKEASQANVKNLLKNGGDLYPNVKETIIELSKKYKLYIVSNCIEGYIESFFKTSDLKEYFSDYECSGKTKLSKGENIKLIIKRNHLKKSIYVGDTISDEEAAKYAKIPFVYASYGFGKVEEYDYLLNDIKDLINIFE